MKIKNMLPVVLLYIILSSVNLWSSDNKMGISSIVTISEVSLNARTTYDLQSNGSSYMIEQNLFNSNLMHAVFLVSTDPAPGWDNRKARYFYSTDGGNTWDYVGPVTVNRSGTPVLSLTNDDRSVVSLNVQGVAVPTQHYIMVDLASGIGSWTELNPPESYMGTSAVMDFSTNKVLFTAGEFINVCTGLNAPGTFLNYTAIPNPSSQSVTGTGTGVYGVAFITLDGSVKLIESTNSGVSWGAPQTVWNRNPIDSLGPLRGIDITYQGNIPKIVFELCVTDPVGGTFSPNRPSKLAFWSRTINGGNAVILDSAGGLSGSNPVNDVFTSISRPVIGVMQVNGLVLAYCRARQDTDAVGNNFFDIYAAYSQDGGTAWSRCQLTNLPGQFNNLMDCLYPSISNMNLGNKAHILCQSDSIPGSNVNGAAASLAKMMYLRLQGGTGGFCGSIGITNNQGELPVKYLLKQNYPNPFNPVTQIEFSIPEKSNVKITIYNSLGETVSVLLDEEVAAGNYKADWNASDYPSGVYLYELKTADYSQTRKMVLLK